MNNLIERLSPVVCLLFSVNASAGPPTLYKPLDVARAKENVAHYRWAQQIVAGWERSVHTLMQKNRQYAEAMISNLTPWPTYGQNCPVCVGKKSSMGECGIYRWRAGDPDKLVCKYCGTSYPNPKYPETGRLVCPRMGQTFTYYQTDAERAHPEDRSGQYAFRWVRWPVHTSWSGLIRTYKANYVIGKVLPLAKLYALTGDVKYAERAAWVLDRFARVYPHYLFHAYNGTYADWPPADVAEELGRHPRAGRFPKDVIINAFNLHQGKDYAMLCNGFWGSGRYSCSGGDGGTILDMTIAYDLIRDARRSDGTRVLTAEMDDRIVHDLILAGCRDSENWQEINNKCGPGRALSAAVGILFDRPESVRWAYEGFQQLMERCFHFDGCCMESPSYSNMHLSLMRDIPEILRGYSDPASYQPRSGSRIEHLQPFQQMTRYRLALESMVRILAPGRRYPVIGDTHYGRGISPIWAEILTDRYGAQYAGLLEQVQGKRLSEAGSEYALWYRDPDLKADDHAALPLHTEWFPGWHVAVLRGGKPDGDTALYLNGYARHGHRHYDTLGLIYYANGQELASDRGYIWDDPRNAWTASTLAHNIVTVDGANQNVSNRHSRLELFGSGPGVEVVQASANAYSQCQQYRRTCVLVQLPDNASYALDIFRVHGGRLHQYGFNANGRLTAVSTAEPQPIDREIRWLSNLRAIQPESPCRVTWDCEDTRLELMLLSDVQRLIVADAPGWRSDSGAELHAPPIQQVLAERRRQDGKLASQFVAIITPYSADRSPILSASLLENNLDTGTVAVQVKLANRVDTIIAKLDDRDAQFGSVTLTGQFAFVSAASDGTPHRAYLLSGTHLSCSESSLRLPQATVPLKVDSISNRTFHLADSLPPGLQATGLYLLTEDSGYEIESTTNNTITVRDYPAIACDQVRILNAAWLSDGEPSKRVKTRTGTAQ